MSASRQSGPRDPKARLIAIFVFAVLLPSVALSAVAFYSVPRQAESMRIRLQRQAERVLWYVGRDLEAAARTAALEAARAVGPRLLLEARPEGIREALREAGRDPGIFESLRLEGATPLPPRDIALGTLDREVDELRESLAAVGPAARRSEEEDSVPLTRGDRRVLGTLRFRFACEYVHGALIRDYFEHEFTNPDGVWVVRVTEPDGRVLFETAPSPTARRFEVERVLEGPSFRGIRLQLRSREGSIEAGIRRWKIAMTAIIALMDVLLAIGLFLVYGNVRREIHLSRLKGDFVANVSHELKTPLALIRLFAETLELGRVASEEKARAYYRVINKESQRLTQLINNILDFSRIEAGRKEYRFAPTSISAIVREVVDAYRYPIEQLGFTLEVETAADIPEISMDKEAIARALLNLLNNAIKFSRDDKQVRVAARRDGDHVRVSVEDRGIGVAKPEHRRIFEKFYRAEDSLVHETKGSGLGLALVKHIAEAHGGSVELESAPGKGSTFTLVLPVSRPGTETEA
jgi:signal transduction histidine kinase